MPVCTDRGYMVTMDTCGRTCALCKNSSNLQRCGRCFRVFYCSKDCQRGDWRNHRDLCQQVTAQAAKAYEGKMKCRSVPVCIVKISHTTQYQIR